MALLASVGSVRMLAMTVRFTATLISGVRVVHPRFVTRPAFPIVWTRVSFSFRKLRVLAMARRFAASLFTGLRVMRARFLTMLGFAAPAMRMLFARGTRSTLAAV